MRYGIRRIEGLDGGVVAWLHPGGADLDEVMVALARHLADEDIVEWWAISSAYTLGPKPQAPEGLPNDGETERLAWETYRRHLPPIITTLDEEFPTSTHGNLDVGWYRRFPWCTCGEEHAWHIEPSAPGRGASLAVVLSWL
jgi:hypothetical protein